MIDMENKQKETNTTIEISIETSACYEQVHKLVKKICEDHEGKRDLHIKIKLT